MARGFVEQGQHRIRTDDVEECFVARVLLTLVPDPFLNAQVEVEVTLRHLFPAFESVAALCQKLDGVTLRRSQRVAEDAANVLSAMLGGEIEAAVQETPALEFYEGWLEQRLGYLRDGDGEVLAPGMIASFERNAAGSFLARFVPTTLVEKLGEALTKRFELVEKLLQIVQKMGGPSAPRIDHRKVLEMFEAALEKRTEATGERFFSIDSNEMPFRHAVQEFEGGLQLPVPGTANPADKVLIPMLLEANGVIDVEQLFFKSDPAETEVEIRYVVRRPSTDNIYGASSLGLSRGVARTLSEIEHSIYARAYRKLQRRFVFGGRPLLERSFGELAAWTLRKQTMCLEEPSFLRDRALDWLKAHANDKYVKAEDDFFLPFLHERLVDAFGGDRIIKKPEKFGGEIDLHFDGRLPIELKVRRGEKEPVGAIIDATYPPTGQAAAYAAVSRLGIVMVLDLPEGTASLANLDACVHVVERDIRADGAFPTCIVVFVFHAHNPKPSAVK